MKLKLYFSPPNDILSGIVDPDDGYKPPADGEGEGEEEDAEGEEEGQGEGEEEGAEGEGEEEDEGQGEDGEEEGDEEEDEDISDELLEKALAKRGLTVNKPAEQAQQPQTQTQQPQGQQQPQKTFAQYRTEMLDHIETLREQGFTREATEMTTKLASETVMHTGNLRDHAVGILDRYPQLPKEIKSQIISGMATIDVDRLEYAVNNGQIDMICKTALYDLGLAPAAKTDAKKEPAPAQKKAPTKNPPEVTSRNGGGNGGRSVRESLSKEEREILAAQESTWGKYNDERIKEAFPERFKK